MRVLVAASFFAIGLSLAPPARAGEVSLNLGTSMRKSTWRGDWLGGGQLGAGYRFARVVALDFVVWEELATIDKRLNTGITFGVTGTVPFPKGPRPTLRLYFIHQHEEGWVSVVERPFGTIAGIGPGIRHRAGLGTRLGLEIPLAEKKKYLEWVLLPGVDATWFPDASLGPALYVGATIGIGFNYSLPEMP